VRQHEYLVLDFICDDRGGLSGAYAAAGSLNRQHLQNKKNIHRKTAIREPGTTALQKRNRCRVHDT